MQLENLGGHYVEYKEAIDALLCQSTVWRDGESNGFVNASSAIACVCPPKYSNARLFSR